MAKEIFGVMFLCFILVFANILMLGNISSDTTMQVVEELGSEYLELVEQDGFLSGINKAKLENAIMNNEDIKKTKSEVYCGIEATNEKVNAGDEVFLKITYYNKNVKGHPINTEMKLFTGVAE